MGNEMNRDVEMAQHWIDRYAAGVDDDLQLDRVIEALCPPVVVTDDMVERATKAIYGAQPHDAFGTRVRSEMRFALTEALKETP